MEIQEQIVIRVTANAIITMSLVVKEDFFAILITEPFSAGSTIFHALSLKSNKNSIMYKKIVVNL